MSHEQLGETALRDKVTAELRSRIINGDYRPGQHLSERILEHDLSSARTPIRQAILCLQKEGLVEIRPQHGTVVRRLGIEEAREIVQARLLMERHVVRALCRKGSVDLGEANSINHEMAEL